MSRPASTPVAESPAGLSAGLPAEPAVDPRVARAAHPGSPRAPRSHRWLTIVMTSAVFAIAALLAISRLPESAREIVWAEDGVYFLADSDREGVWGTLLKPYMGYLHFIPRIIVSATSTFADISAFAVIVAVVCCIVVGALTALVFHCSSAVTTWLPARLAIASVTVLVPTAPIEVLGNTANLHWYLLWASVWVLLYVPRTWRGSVALGLLATSFALTEILVALLAPLVFFRFRTAKMWPIRAGYAVGLTAQAIATLNFPRPLSTDPPDVVTTVQGYLIHGPSAVFVSSEPALGSLLADTGWWIGLVFLAPFVLSALYLFWRGSAVARVAAITLFVLGILVFALAFYGVVMSDYWDYPNYTTEQFRDLTIQRYSVIASMCLIPLPVLAAVTLRERWMTRAQQRGIARLADARQAPARVIRPNRRRIVQPTPEWVNLLVVALKRAPVLLIPFAMVAVMVVGFVPEATRRDGHPNWAETVETAREDCAGARSSAEASLPVAPGGDWNTILGCDTVTDGAGHADGPRG